MKDNAYSISIFLNLAHQILLGPNVLFSFATDR